LGDLLKEIEKRVWPEEKAANTRRLDL
jgi:hypothetical protein